MNFSLFIVLLFYNILAISHKSKPPIALQEAKRNSINSDSNFLDPLLFLDPPARYRHILGGAATTNNSTAVSNTESTNTDTESSDTESNTRLDSSIYLDKIKIVSIFDYCTALYYRLGISEPCIRECTPNVNDCGNIAYKICLPSKENYSLYVKCIHTEFEFCEKHNINYVNIKFPTISKADKSNIKNVIDYCGTMFQLTGVKLTCLRRCSIFYWKIKDSDSLNLYRANTRMRRSRKGLRNYNYKEDPLGYGGRNDLMNECTMSASLICSSTTAIKTTKQYITCFHNQKRSCQAVSNIDNNKQYPLSNAW